MKKFSKVFLKYKPLSVAILLTICIALNGQQREVDFNFNWKFSLTNDTKAIKQNYDDSEWRTLDLPHDWSVEFPFDSVNGEGCTGYLPGGIGWYRKHFNIDTKENMKYFIHFDGVYNNSEYWINGKKLGAHPYGYSPFYYDITSYLSKSGNNVIAVKVDRSRIADSRWYTGSGIYRNVKLVTLDKLHIPIWGTYITTPEVSFDKAEISVQIDVENNYSSEQKYDLKTYITDPNGTLIETISTSNRTLSPGKDVITQSVTIASPMLWSIDNPNVYKAVTTIVKDGAVIDRVESKFGIRTFRFDANKGFFLNGNNIKIKGVCLHHDAGPVGAAVPKEVWRRRLSKLKEGGCNAIRISHNPGSDEFLDLCDEMGFLVQDEFFDEWNYPKDKRLNEWEKHDDYQSRGYSEKFNEWAGHDLKNTMLAHRNHPSIIQWSIGNEIEWTYETTRKATGFFDNMDWQGNYFWSPPPYSPEKIRETYKILEKKKYPVEETAKQLAQWTRELDPTRPVIANCILPSGSFETGYADQLDIVGFSYRRIMYDYAKENYPEKVVMGTECLPQWHEWKAAIERPFVAGVFLWTGIDHMGEVHDRWPQKVSNVGLIDQAGFEKPVFHMFKSLWTAGPHIYICSQLLDSSEYKKAPNGSVVEREPGAWEQKIWFWPDLNEHWNYSTGEEVVVQVLSNCEEVELFLNDESLGIKQLSDFPDRIYKWAMPYKPGTITAKGIRGGIRTKASITTTSNPVRIEASSDRTMLNADNYDVAHITVQLYDENGNPVKNIKRKISFELDDKLKNLGVDNGNPLSTQDYKSDEILTHNGQALLIVQTGLVKGDSKIKVRAEGIPEEEITIRIR